VRRIRGRTGFPQRPAARVAKGDGNIHLTDGDNDLQIVVTVNGPGEVSSWLHPLALALKQRLPSARICVALVPCVFSSGSELAVVKSLPYVDASFSIDETMGLIWRNRTPAGLRRKAPGLVLHLGGDVIFSVLLSRRLGVPCLAYAERPVSLPWFFDKVFYSGFEKLPANKDARDIVGEMMVDAARMRCPQRSPARSGKMTVGLYPGSRDYLVKFMLPFYAAAAELVREAGHDVEWLLAKSDFLAADFLRAIPSVDDDRPLEGVDLTWAEEGGRQFLVTPSGLRIAVATHGEVASRANLVLTLPGTNTAELSALGVPMVVTVPTYQSERVPMPGIAGHIGRLPVIGKYIKRGVARLIVRKLKFMSHPNRRLDRMLVPEMIGYLTARQVADRVIDMLSADTRALEDELRATMGAPGASQRLASALVDYLNTTEAVHEAAPAR
jgi:lipid-A-disaccharide synthase